MLTPTVTESGFETIALQYERNREEYQGFKNDDSLLASGPNKNRYLEAIG